MGLQYLKDPLSPVLQCTGLEDVKGVPIWEGDIVEVQCEGVGIKRVKEIVWMKEKACFGYRDVNDGDEFIVSIPEADYLVNPKVIGNRCIAPPELYTKIVRETSWELEINEKTGLETVIYTGVKRPDGDDIILYLVRDFDEDRIYLTDYQETAMFIATCGVE